MKRYSNLLPSIFLFFLLSCGGEEKGKKQVLGEGQVEEASYDEQHRPQFHYSPPKMWMNDPNGMVYYDGEYHLFYQHNPDETVWGPMHWGHAVSEDLVHWQNLPIALYPDEKGMIFSGSAVVDKDNTAGFKTGEEDVLVAIFTHHNMEMEQAGESDLFQYQSIAYSNDRGRSWTKYQGNPVIANPGIRDFRDPKVFWHEPSQRWVMILASFDRVKIYNSLNLKDWTESSEFGEDWGSHTGVWECPDLIEVDVNGNPRDKKWLMIVSVGSGGPNGGSGTQYFVGDFDGETFKLDPDLASSLSQEETYVPEGIVFDDFERMLYKNWEREGKAFRRTLAKGSLGGQQEVKGVSGKRLVNSFGKGDEAKGKLISEKFIIQKKYINFLIGGGNHKGKTCMNLIVADKIAATATGEDSETLQWASWEVDKLMGQEAHFEIVDDYSEAWGHILIDNIMFADEKAYSSKAKAMWLDYGKDNYAGVTWSNIPSRDGRHLFIGWMSNWQYANRVPTAGWRSAMTIPRELELVRQGGKIIALTHPVKELKELRKNEESIEIKSRRISSVINPLATIKMDTPLVELILDIKVGEGGQGGIVLQNESLGDALEIGYDHEKQRFFIDRSRAGNTDFSDNFADDLHTAPLISEDGLLSMHIFIDVSSVEVFINNGELVMTELFFPSQPFSKIGFFSKNGSANLKGEVWMLRSIW